MDNLVVRVTPHRLRSPLYGTGIEAVYDVEDRGTGDYFRATFDALDAHTPTQIMLDALMDAPEFCKFAAAALDLARAGSEDITDADALDILVRLRNSDQPEIIRREAGKLMCILGSAQ
jgi:hypothetical protein